MIAGVVPTRRIDRGQAWPLHFNASSRTIEQQAQAALPPNTLMQRAGYAIAELALAIAPHSQRIWVACGPGNNGGDGLEAAIHLQSWGKEVHVSWLGQLDRAPADCQMAHARARAAGLTLSSSAPEQWDLAIDALLGLGGTRAAQAEMANWLARMHAAPTPLLQVDLPSGLSADTGVWHGHPSVSVATLHTLCLLTLKPGLFTADGRDACGEVWFNPLGVTPSTDPDAWLQAGQLLRPARKHNSHKGSYGDVAVIGGAPGMTGAALLAGYAALHGGAGRVFLGLLDAQAQALAGVAHPTLMSRNPDELDVKQSTVVCGCGGGDAVRAWMPRVLSHAPALVLDADGLHALQDSALMSLLVLRHARQRQTVLTPHPLEAARLLGVSTADIQADRLEAARELAARTRAVIILKGSGSIIAAQGRQPMINPTGNARLAVAGSGDVLAGCVGADLAQGLSAWDAACRATARHGQVADDWPSDRAFSAWALAQHMSP